MAVIKPKFVTASEEYLFVIDDKGRVWRQEVERKDWVYRGNLPDDSEVNKPVNGVPPVAESKAEPNKEL
jgi:hypothetical protein